MEYITPFALIGAGLVILGLLQVLVPLFLLRIYSNTDAIRKEAENTRKEMQQLRVTMKNFHHDVTRFLDRVELSR